MSKGRRERLRAGSGQQVRQRFCDPRTAEGESGIEEGNARDQLACSSATSTISTSRACGNDAGVEAARSTSS
jgi:hypothetical protein